MKYLPKSKLGATFAILYLLLLGLLFGLILMTSDGNLHNPAPLIFFSMILILTLPLSWLAMSDSIPNGYLAFGIAICAIIFNTTVIYLVVGFANQMVRKFLSPSQDKSREESL